MPQFNFAFYPSQIFWLLLVFGLLFFFLRGVVLPKISFVLEERHNRIANDLDLADTISLRAEELTQLYNQALSTARKEAIKIMAEIEEDVQKQMDEKLAQAVVHHEAVFKECEEKIKRQIDALNVSDLASHTACLIVQHITGNPCELERAQHYMLKGK